MKFFMGNSISMFQEIGHVHRNLFRRWHFWYFYYILVIEGVEMEIFWVQFRVIWLILLNHRYLIPGKINSCNGLKFTKPKCEIRKM